MRKDFIVSVLLVFLAAAGFLLSRMGLTDLKFAAMNPIRDRELLARIASGTESLEEARLYLTRGSETAAETLYIPPLAVLKVLALAHRTALADLLFVRAHAYFLSHFFTDRIFAWLDHYYQAIVGLDPDNPKIYLWAAQVVKYGQHIDDHTILRSNRFLEQGLKRFPDDWRLHMDLGFNLYFEFKGENEAERSAAKLQARDHFAKAASLPGSPMDPNFIAELFERGNQEGLALAYALERYYNATENQRKQLLRRISMISDVLALQIKAEEQRYRSEFPFLTVPLYSLLGAQTFGPLAPTVWDALRKKDE